MGAKKKKKLSPDEKWALWRRRIFYRDRYTCQLCGKRGGYLEPHHIKRKIDYPRLKFNVYNGITLCGSTGKYKGCHDIITGYEYEWEPLLKKIRQRKLTVRFLNKFISNLPERIATRIREAKRDYMWDNLHKKAVKWAKRKKKK